MSPNEAGSDPDSAVTLLTDTPTAANVLVGGGVPWLPGGPAAAGAALWTAFGGDAPWWAATTRLPGVGDDPWLLVVDDAPRSQFDQMNERLAAGAALPDGFACVALSGSRFRGQRGRPWVALRGNLHLSLHLALDLDAAAAQVDLTLLPAVATAWAVESVSSGRVRPATKWVNDLLVEGRKVAGVLTTTQVLAGRVRHAVFGVGVNVAAAPTLPGAAPAAAPGSLAPLDDAFAGPDAWAALLRAVLAGFAAGRAALAARGTLFEAYRARAAFVGRDVTIWPVDGSTDGRPEPVARGRVLDLRPDLSLVLRGVASPIRTGRMTIDD